MKKRIFATVLMLLLCAVCVFSAEQAWYSDKILRDYDANGLVNVEPRILDAIMSRYIGKPFNDAVFDDIQKRISKVEGIDYINASVSSLENPDYIKLTVTYHELPYISAINYKGNERVKSSDINSKLTSYAIGKFIDVSGVSFEKNAVDEVKNAYSGKGFDDIPVELKWTLDEETNRLTLNFTIQESIQTRVADIIFAGNEHASSSALKKALSQKTKSIFTNGFFDKEKVDADIKAICNYYSTLGYIEAEVLKSEIEDIEDSSEKYNDVNVVYYIDEGEQWLYGGMDVNGNTVYSDEELNELLTVSPGTVINMDNINAQISRVSDKYYNNGYIGCNVSLADEKNEDDRLVYYHLNLNEGMQAHVEKIVISGLTKTEEYIMKREVTLKEGEVFSKADLITSAQNIYNTGLLTDINYDIYFGEEENGVIVEFMVTEGNQMDIQFGATFGGNVDGFPISGFLSWSNHNLGGKARDISVSSNLSPDSQTVAVSLGDRWFKDKRWANSVSLSFSHNKYEGELQRAGKAYDYYDGRNSDDVFPAGTGSPEHWKETNGEYPSSQFLMDYRLITVGLGYDTGYTFIWNPGRLSLNGGLKFSLNKAFYDDEKFDPFEKMTAKYHEKWQFSNKLTFGAQWDGRDYVENTSKGYLLGTSFTYAGGLLGGLSNYQKLSTSGAFYVKIASFGDPSDSKNLMFCASSNVSLMLPQLYKNDEDYKKKGFGFHDPHLGATKYEMLYIDGMTTARGHDIVYDQVFMWDNMLEFSYPLVKNVLNAEVFGSATALVKDYDDFKKGLNWYFSTGFGVKFKISGFPLGFYLVKNATNIQGNTFSWGKGSIFNGNNKDNSGMKFVLAISTSLI